MPDFKKIWPDLLYKILMAILAVIFGYNQYQDTEEHKQFHDDIDVIHQYLQADPYAHTDYLNGGE